MNPHNRQYHIIFVHHGNPTPTIRLLNTLKRSHCPPNQVVVIDHASRPLKIKCPENYYLVRPSHNLGYAAGLNCGLGVLHSVGAKANDIIICLNNDILFSKDTMQKLRQWWHQHPADALVGLVTKTQNSLISYGRINLLTGRAVLQNSPNTTSPATTLWTIPYIHGAAFAAPFATLIKNKGLPEQYFMYWEDALLSVNLSKSGIPLRVATQVIVSHRNSSDQKSPPKTKTYYLVRGGAMFLEQATPLFWRPYWWTINRLRYLYHLIFSRHRQPVIMALRDAIHHRTGPAPNHLIDLK